MIHFTMKYYENRSTKCISMHDLKILQKMKDKELIENSRLRERTGGYHKFVDSAEVHNPDPTSSHFISGKHYYYSNSLTNLNLFPD